MVRLRAAGVKTSEGISAIPGWNGALAGRPAPADTAHGPGTAATNLGCHLVKPGPAARQLLRLEATLTPAGQRGLQFMSGVLYDVGPSRWAMHRNKRELPLALGPGESRLQGVQFVGPRIAPRLVRAPERPTVEIVGWCDRPGRREPPDLHCRFALRLGEDEATQLAPWLAADGPDHRALVPAAAIPLAIDASPPV